MDKAQLLIAMMGAGGGGAALLAFVTGMWKWVSGASGRERARVTAIAAQRQTAIEDRIKAELARDLADHRRRCAEEHVSLLKRQLIEAGLIPVKNTADKEKPDGPT